MGPRTAPSHAARGEATWVCFSCRSPTSCHAPPFHTPSNLLWPWNACLEAKKIGTQTEANCATTVNGHENRENPSEQKSSHFILCPTFLVPRNAKQRRGNCHNPIFTPGIFSGVNTQNEVARTQPNWPQGGQPYLKTLKMGPGSHFLEFGEVWPTLTRIDQVWQRFDRGVDQTKNEIGWPIPNHWIEHIESFDSVLYRSKTDEKRESYGQNRENRSNT